MSWTVCTWGQRNISLLMAISRNGFWYIHTCIYDIHIVQSQFGIVIILRWVSPNGSSWHLIFADRCKQQTLLWCTLCLLYKLCCRSTNMETLSANLEPQEKSFGKFTKCCEATYVYTRGCGETSGQLTDKTAEFLRQRAHIPGCIPALHCFGTHMNPPQNGRSQREVAPRNLSLKKRGYQGHKTT